jgi:hypothetical protein
MVLLSFSHDEGRIPLTRRVNPKIPLQWVLEAIYVVEPQLVRNVVPLHHSDNLTL